MSDANSSAAPWQDFQQGSDSPAAPTSARDAPPWEEFGGKTVAEPPSLFSRAVSAVAHAAQPITDAAVAEAGRGADVLEEAGHQVGDVIAAAQEEASGGGTVGGAVLDSAVRGAAMLGQTAYAGAKGLVEGAAARLPGPGQSRESFMDAAQRVIEEANAEAERANEAVPQSELSKSLINLQTLPVEAGQRLVGEPLAEAGFPATGAVAGAVEGLVAYPALGRVAGAGAKAVKGVAQDVRAVATGQPTRAQAAKTRLDQIAAVQQHAATVVMNSQASPALAEVLSKTAELHAAAKGVNATDPHSHLAAAVDGTPDAVLRATSARYNAMRDLGFPEGEVKGMLKARLADAAESTPPPQILQNAAERAEAAGAPAVTGAMKAGLGLPVSETAERVASAYTPDEQAKLDFLDEQLSATRNEVTQKALQKQKEVIFTVVKNRRAADELRASARQALDAGHTDIADGMEKEAAKLSPEAPPATPGMEVGEPTPEEITPRPVAEPAPAAAEPVPTAGIQAGEGTPEDRARAVAEAGTTPDEEVTRLFQPGAQVAGEVRGEPENVTLDAAGLPTEGTIRDHQGNRLTDAEPMTLLGETDAHVARAGEGIWKVILADTGQPFAQGASPAAARRAAANRAVKIGKSGLRELVGRQREVAAREPSQQPQSPQEPSHEPVRNAAEQPGGELPGERPVPAPQAAAGSGAGAELPGDHVDEAVTPQTGEVANAARTGKGQENDQPQHRGVPQGADVQENRGQAREVGGRQAGRGGGNEQRAQGRTEGNTADEVAAPELWQKTRADVLRETPHRDDQGYIENNRMQANALDAHRVAVVNALADGKPVPAKVRADYPALTTEIAQASPELVAPVEAVHKEPGEPAKPATVPEVNKAADAAKDAGFDPVVAKGKLLGEIDAAVARALSRAEALDKADAHEEMDRKTKGLVVRPRMAATYLDAKMQDAEAAKRAGRSSQDIYNEIGHVSFDVPGDGRFKVLNTKENLAAFRKNVERSQGFKKKMPDERPRYVKPSMRQVEPVTPDDTTLDKAAAARGERGPTITAKEGHTFEVYDRQTGMTVGTYKDLKQAGRAKDRMDNAYGGYRYGTRPITPYHELSTLQQRGEQVQRGEQAPTGITLSATRAALGDRGQVWENASQMPEDVARRLGVTDTTEGVKDPQTGDVHLFADALASPERAKEVAAQLTSPHTADTLRATLVTHLSERGVGNLEKAGLLNIVRNADALPEDLPAGLKDQVRTDPQARAFYDPASKRAFLIADRIPAGKELATAFHEIGDHYGIENILGRDRYLKFLNDVRGLRAAGSKEARAAWDHVRRNYEHLDENSHGFVREVSARLVEDAPNLPLVRRLMAQVRAWAYRLGLRRALNEDTIRGLATQALRKAMRGDTPQVYHGLEEPAFARGGAGAETQEELSRTEKIAADVPRAIDRIFSGKPRISDEKIIRGQYLGAVQRYNGKISQWARDFNKKFSKPVQRAMARYREAGGDESLLRQWADTTKDSGLKKVYEDALNLSPEQKSTTDQVGTLFNEKGQEAVQAGLLDGMVDNYVAHAGWDRSSKPVRKLMAQVNAGVLKNNPKFAKQRSFATFFEGEQAGMKHKPDGDTIGFSIASWLSAFEEAKATRAYLQKMMDVKMPDGRPLVFVGGAGFPSVDRGAFFIKPNMTPAEAFDYKAFDHPAMRQWKWVGPGNTHIEGQMLIHPDAVKNMNALLGRSKIRDWTIPHDVPLIGGVKPGDLALRASSFVKGTVMVGPFHQMHTSEHAVFHGVNPLNAPPIDFAHKLTSDLIDHGLMVNANNALADFGEGLHGGGLLGWLGGKLKSGGEAVLKEGNPLRGITDRADVLQRYGQYLFGDNIPRLKVAMAINAVGRAEKWFAKDLASGALTRDQLLENVANHANAAFGELNYRYMGRNPTLQDAYRLLLLAPDFLEARMKFGAQALQKYGTEQRRALLKGAVIMATLAQSINTLFGDNGKPDWTKPFTVTVGGRDYTPRSVVADIFHLVTDWRGFALHRVNPLLVRPPAEAAFMRNIYGEKVDAEGLAQDIAKSWTPIPAQGLFKNDPSSKGAATILNTIVQSLGVTNYPSKTDFQRALTEQHFKHRGDLSPEDRAKSKRFGDAIRARQAGEHPDLSWATVQQKKLINKDVHTPMEQTFFEQLPVPEQLDLWDKATPEERVKFKLKQTINRHLLKETWRVEQRNMSLDNQRSFQERVNAMRAWQPDTVH